MIEALRIMSGMDISGRNKVLFAANADFIISSIQSGIPKRRIYAKLKADNSFNGTYSWFLRMCKQKLPLYGCSAATSHTCTQTGRL